MKSIQKDILKKVAIIFVTLFLIALIVGVVKAYKVRHSFETATVEQINLVKNIVAEELTKRGSTLDSYEFDIGRRMRKNITQVSLTEKENKESTKSTKKEIYIIDLARSKVLMHSTTEFFEPFEKHKGRETPTGRFFADRK